VLQLTRRLAGGGGSYRVIPPGFEDLAVVAQRRRLPGPGRGGDERDPVPVFGKVLDHLLLILSQLEAGGGYLAEHTGDDTGRDRPSSDGDTSFGDAAHRPLRLDHGHS